MKPELIGWFRRAFLRHEPRRHAVMQPRTADRKYNDHPGNLTDRQIADHLAGRTAYAVPTAENGLASFLPLDVDAGGLAAIAALLDAAKARNLWAFAQYDPSAGRGYVWIPFDDLVNAERLRRLGDELLTQVQPQAHGWKIENRATNEDTRLPFARHRWTGRRGLLDAPSGQLADLDSEERYPEILARFAASYRENPTTLLPPPPEPQARPERPGGTPGQGVTIARYNATTDLVQLLEHYGARRARGQGARLYFCPLHGDDHASLLVSRDGTTCRCMSAGSDCPLSVHQHDAFNVYCAGEGLTPQQALRRLNGLPDDPPTPSGFGGRSPERGSGPSTPPRDKHPSASPQTPPEGPREARNAKTGYTPTPKPVSATVRPSQGQLALTTTPQDGRRLPKTCRRVLDIIAQHPHGYIRGKYRLAELLDCDPRTVQRSLRRLEAEGLIQRRERGKEGQTDIYQLAPIASYDTIATGAANRVADQPEAEAEREPEGRQMPPTLEHESIPSLESLEAERGGSPPAIPSAEQLAELLATGDQAEGIHGPAGAVVFFGGASYVPPEAEDWYHCLLQLAPSATPPAPEPEPEQTVLAVPERAGQPEAAPPRAGTRKRRKKASTYTDPGRLHGRIIAAERKAAKLETTGKAADRRQAAAIRRQAEQLKRQLETVNQGLYSAEEADDWQPPAPQAREPAKEERTPGRGATTAPPSSLSSFGLDWRYLETLARAGEVRGIETHCRLCRADVGEVLSILQQRRL